MGGDASERQEIAGGSFGLAAVRAGGPVSFAAMSPEGLPPPPPPPPRGPGGRGMPGQVMPRWGLYALLGLILSALLLGPLVGGAGDPEAITYAEFMTAVREGKVASVEIDNTDGSIDGTRTDGEGGDEFRTTGPLDGGIPESDLVALRENDVDVEYKTPSPNWFISLLPFLLPMVILVGFFWFMNRRA